MKGAGGGGEGLVFFCDDVEIQRELRRDWAKGEGPAGGVHEPCQRQCVADAVLHEEGGVIDEIVGGDDLEHAFVAAEPVEVLVAVEGLVGEDDRQRFELVDVDLVLRCQGIVVAHQEAVDVLGVDVEIIVALLAHRPQKQAHVAKPFVDAFAHSVGVAAEGVELHIRILPLKICHHAADDIHGDGFAAADREIAVQRFVFTCEGVLRLLHEGDDLLGAIAQIDAIVCQRQPSSAAQKKLLAQLALQLLHLFGEGRLGEEEGLRRFCDVELPRYGKKIHKQSRFDHGYRLLATIIQRWIIPVNDENA